MFVDFLKGMKVTALNGYCIVGFDNFENFAVAMMYVNQLRGINEQFTWHID